MKEQILKALKTKYKNLGFGEKAFEGVAEYLAKTVTEEANIETAIDGVEGMLKVFQSEADKLRGENVSLKSQLEAAKKTETKTEAPDTKGDDDKGKGGDETPKWAKELFEEVRALKADKVTGSRKSQLDDKLKDVPEALKKLITANLDLSQFENDAKFSEYLDGVSTQVEELTKQMKIDGVLGNGKSQKGIGGNVGDKPATKEELDVVMPKMY